MRAVVVAGGINRRALYEGYKPGYKALVQIGGRPLIAYVMEALEGAVDEIGIVGDETALSPVTGRRKFAHPGKSLLESLIQALKMFPDDPYVLLVPGDLPMMKKPMVEQFLLLCQQRPRGDFYLAMVPEERFVPPFDQIRKYMSPFKDGVMCHGNLALVNPDVLQVREAMDRIDPVYQERLSPIRSAMALGPGLGLVYMLGVHFFHRLKMETFARIAGRHFGLKLIPIVCPYPELAIDVDEPADYRVACEVLGQEVSPFSGRPEKPPDPGSC